MTPRIISDSSLEPVRLDSWAGLFLFPQVFLPFLPEELHRQGLHREQMTFSSYKVEGRFKKGTVYQVVRGMLGTMKDSRVTRDSTHRTVTNEETLDKGVF